MSTDVLLAAKEEKGMSFADLGALVGLNEVCLLYTSPSPRDRISARLPSSA